MDTLNVRAELKERLMQDVDPNAIVSSASPSLFTLITHSHAHNFE